MFHRCSLVNTVDAVSLSCVRCIIYNDRMMECDIACLYSI